MSKPTRNSETLADFVAYCEAHPDERFWQALKNWSGYDAIAACQIKPRVLNDTFYWEGRNR